MRRFASIALLPIALFIGLSPLLGPLGAFSFHAHGGAVHSHAGGGAAHDHTADHTHDSGWAVQLAVDVDAHRREHAQLDPNEILARMVPVGRGEPAAPAEPEPSAPIVPLNDQVPLDDEAPAPTYCSLSQTDVEPVCIPMSPLPVALALLLPGLPESAPAAPLISGASGRAPPSGPLLQT